MIREKGTVPFSLNARLRELIPAYPDAALCVAFSGGMDSLALLHAARQLVVAEPRLRLRALHVDHGLQPESADWARHCAAICAGLGVPVEVLRLELAVGKGASVEAEARAARYAAFAAALSPGEQLLTAHHADDQLETVLLQLFRGAGVQGLAAMPSAADLGAGRHLRPWLGVTRRQLQDYVAGMGLAWIEDPMNHGSRYDRSYLRHHVLPAVRERWPAVARTVGRSAAHLGQARSLIEQLARHDGAALLDAGRLDIAGLLSLPPERRVNVLRWWIAGEGLTIPSTARLEAILRDVVPARDDAQPVVTWRGGEVRRHRGGLHAMRPLPAARDGEWQLDGGGSVRMPGSGMLSLERTVGEGISAVRFPGPFRVAVRTGGRSASGPEAEERRRIRRLIGRARVEPWLRCRLPLVYCGPSLIAIGDRWIERGSLAAAEEPSFAVRWEPGAGWP